MDAPPTPPRDNGSTRNYKVKLLPNIKTKKKRTQPPEPLQPRPAPRHPAYRSIWERAHPRLHDTIDRMLQRLDAHERVGRPRRHFGVPGDMDLHDPDNQEAFNLVHQHYILPHWDRGWAPSIHPPRTPGRNLDDDFDAHDPFGDNPEFVDNDGVPFQRAMQRNDMVLPFRYPDQWPPVNWNGHPVFRVLQPHEEANARINEQLIANDPAIPPGLFNVGRMPGA